MSDELCVRESRCFCGNFCLNPGLKDWRMGRISRCAKDRPCAPACGRHGRLAQLASLRARFSEPLFMGLEGSQDITTIIAPARARKSFSL
jgi:hypothetical protein